MWRRVIAMVGHAPALWLVYREPLPRAVRRPNLYAVLATLTAMLVAGVRAPPGGRLTAVLVTWAIGHGLWGIYLFVRLPPPDAD
jgi:hypothetical protein